MKPTVPDHPKKCTFWLKEVPPDPKETARNRDPKYAPGPTYIIVQRDTQGNDFWFLEILDGVKHEAEWAVKQLNMA